MSIIFLEESIAILEESADILEESADILAESAEAFESVLELLHAAKAPIARTNKSFFMLRFFVLIEWFRINTKSMKK
ncbi:MAG: hypothetical protein Q8927_15960 [Bacteroidota bacterium]|nr:hypothetical protein [Bacteroidota bacterium]MDP4253000.1 hypothetical protein [Bacteroidota bacterium]